MGVDGIIMEPTVISLADDLLKELLKESFPIVFVDRSIDMDFPVPTIITDNNQGGKLLGEHMRKVHKIESAVFVTSEDLNISSVNERYEGIKAGLKFGPTIMKVPVIDGDYSNLVRHLKKNHEQAIFFCNDMMAVRGYSFLLNKGFTLPKDIKIIGFDNDYVSKILEPKLTTVKQNLPQLGEYAASVMVRLIKKEHVEDENRIPVSLVVRESCGCKENKEDIRDE
jgi:DNA-binding LacI/PurR family transcriptional regulator